MQWVESILLHRFKNPHINVDAESYPSRAGDESSENIPALDLRMVDRRFAMFLDEKVEEGLSIIASNSDLQPLLWG